MVIAFWHSVIFFQSIRGPRRATNSHIYAPFRVNRWPKHQIKMTFTSLSQSTNRINIERSVFEKTFFIVFYISLSSLERFFFLIKVNASVPAQTTGSVQSSRPAEGQCLSFAVFSSRFMFCYFFASLDWTPPLSRSHFYLYPFTSFHCVTGTSVGAEWVSAALWLMTGPDVSGARTLTTARGQRDNTQ